MLQRNQPKPPSALGSAPHFQHPSLAILQCFPACFWSRHRERDAFPRHRKDQKLSANRKGAMYPSQALSHGSTG